MNKRSFDQKILETLESEDERKDSVEENKNENKETIADLFKHPRVLFRFLIMLSCQ